MTSPSETSRRRKLPAALLALLSATAGLALAGWSVTADDGRGSPTPAPVVAVAPTTEAAAATTSGAPTTDAPTTGAPTTDAPTTSASSTTTTANVLAAVAPAALPVPEDAPTDPYADTPYVVHGTLALPTIGVSQPLHEGVTLTAINHGPSHWPGTAMPGQVGNVVVAGHRTTYTRPFYDLDLLQVGDPLVFTMNDGSVFTYEMTATSIVDPDGMHILSQSSEPTATLFACHPKGSAAHRIVAHFRLVDASPA
jgi:sortase A